ncbi:type IV secretory system conjugative DNA transfer family protein [Kocuria palustris]|uniref:type IV secretory system conjugative DNA transfer family protein n=2 Tax=Micrococcales TaxID=85006 RepID=UPI00077B7E24|nr:type IV secretory system conjugative DNA transfer family protein [Kocuria palustris]
MALLNRSRGSSPKASAWDKLSTRTNSQKLAFRDVHNSQQLDYKALPKLRSKKAGYIGAGILAALTAVMVWVLYSVVMLMLSLGSAALSGIGSGSGSQTQEQAYYDEVVEGGQTCYQLLDQNGQPDPSGGCFASVEEVPVPSWYVPPEQAEAAEQASQEQTQDPELTLGAALATVSGFKVFLTLSLGGGAGLAVGETVRRRVDTSNLMSRTDDIHQYDSDQHIALPEEIQRTYDWFPDVGAQSSVQVSSMLSHMMLSHKGLPSVEMPQRTQKDVLDEDGDVELYEGEIITDDEGEIVRKTVPLIDEAFGRELFEASGLFDKKLQRFFETKSIPYNADGTDRDKLGQYKNVAELIKADWHLPDYEPQRPAGAYIIDSAPVNTMVLAMTRAGKGQTYIEPTLDMWSRERAMNNFLANDPKGELLVKFYVRLVTRGFEVVQFNLINILKTDIYNPLGLAADSAREGDFTKMAMYVENIAEVFFPVDGGDDPVWPNAANNAFKRSAYGLIDLYLEEEAELRAYAEATGMHPAALEQRLDEMWGNVTLYNCYQLFVQLTSKKLKNPQNEFDEKVKNGEFEEDPEAEEIERAAVEAKAVMWEDKPELDMLTLLFNATAQLPRSTMRDRIANTDNALRAMAGADKMIASVYGIALTAMSFFTDPTISTMTSGRPSQNVDLGGLSFPRRFGVRFTAHFMKSQSLMGMQAVWSAYADPMFTENLGKDFEHSDMVSREGWARYYFKGIFPKNDAWVKLELRNSQSGSLVRRFYFHFTKSYQLSLNGRRFIKEPVTEQKQIKNGVLREMRPVLDDDGEIKDFEYASTLYTQPRLEITEDSEPFLTDTKMRAIMQTSVRYAEKPKAVFLVTPPHLTKYAKLILILLKQLVDLNFDKSYMTKSSQKPLFKTRFMLDELGNLQSEGSGIANFETMLSIGLGQEQQFTIILQTLAQLTSVYGESVDSIVKGNTSNIIYLKSTDDSMLDTLEKLSGKRHRGYRDGKSVTQDVAKVVGTGRTEGKVSYNFNLKEEPLISTNDLLYLAPRNSVVFRAGDPPIWNRNETILPMSWRLFKNTIQHPGHEYSLQTIPTMSTASEFDVRMNQPDFAQALDKRMRQAVEAVEAKDQYMALYGYEEIDIKRLDPDVYSEEVMALVTNRLKLKNGADPTSVYMMDPEEENSSYGSFDDDQVIDNIEQAEETARYAQRRAEYEQMRYAEGQVSREMLVTQNGAAKLGKMDSELIEAYQSVRREMETDEDHFSVNGAGELCSVDGRFIYLKQASDEDLQQLSGYTQDADARVYAEGDLSTEDLTSTARYSVTSEFYCYLAELDHWKKLAGGAFERAMSREIRAAREDHA